MMSAMSLAVVCIAQATSPFDTIANKPSLYKIKKDTPVSEITETAMSVVKNSESRENDTIVSKNDDVRNWVPQLTKENIARNQPIIDLLTDYAQKKGATCAQISLAWMLHKYPNVVPIPGSKNKERIIENLDAATVKLTTEEFTSLEAALNRYKVYGHRGFRM